ncbi:MAG: MFS transporter [Actinomycetota bacterium]
MVERTDVDDRRSELPVNAAGVHPVPTVPWPLLLRRRVQEHIGERDSFRWWVLAVSLGGMFATGFTITILAVAVPGIADEFDSDTATISWIVTAPILVFGLVGPTLGRAGDIFGHRRLYLGGLALAAVFAGLTSLAWDPASLIAFRTLAAAVGAATGPSAMAMINRVFPAEQRVTAMGYWALVGAGGPVLGVVVGGPAVEQYGWRAIFVFQAPVTLLAVIIAAMVLPSTPRRPGTRLDLAGAATLAGATLSILLAINRGPSAGWTAWWVIGLAALSPLMLWWFVRIQRRVTDPLIPLRSFGQRNVSVPLVVLAFVQFAYMGGFILTPLLLDAVYFYGETRIGLLSISRPLAFAITGPLVGFVAVKVGERVTAVAGTALVAASMFVLAAAATSPSDTLVVGALVLSGIGLGSASPSLAAAVANSVDEEDFGVAGAMQLMVSQIGVVIGIQVMQAVQAGAAPSCSPLCIGGAAIADIGESFRLAYLVGGGAAAVSAIVALGIRSAPRAERAPTD